MKKFNGYDFDDVETSTRIKYLVVLEGDLDINGAYGFKSRKELMEFVRSEYDWKKIQAVFAVKAIDVSRPRNMNRR